MPNDQDPDIRTYATIDDRIGEAVQRKPATITTGRDSKVGIRDKERRDAFELVQKPLRNTTPSFFSVKTGRLTQVALGVWVQGEAHNSSARSFAMTSDPRTGFAAPLSISVSRLAAS